MERRGRKRPICLCFAQKEHPKFESPKKKESGLVKRKEERKRKMKRFPACLPNLPASFLNVRGINACFPE
jgi:hypothetical protein